MVTREEMVAAFGEAALRLMVEEQVRKMGVSDQDAMILCQVGLPVRADIAFTRSVPYEPSQGSLVVLETGHGDVDVLILGATRGGDMRYFLDIQGGTIGLLSLDEPPQTERVNSSLENFVEFLHRLRVRQQKVLDAAENDAECRQHTEALWPILKELDPVAFSSTEAWWSMILDTLMHRTYFDEMREFLVQRGAEVAMEAAG